MATGIPAIASNSATAAVGVSNSPGAGKAQSTSFLDMLAKATDTTQPLSALPLLEPRLKETAPTKTGNGNKGSAKSGSAMQPAASPLSLASSQLQPQLSVQDLNVAAMSMRGMTAPGILTTGTSDSVSTIVSDSSSNSASSDSVALAQSPQATSNPVMTGNVSPSLVPLSRLEGGAGQLSGGIAKSGSNHTVDVPTGAGTCTGTGIVANVDAGGTNVGRGFPTNVDAGVTNAGTGVATSVGTGVGTNAGTAVGTSIDAGVATNVSSDDGTSISAGVGTVDVTSSATKVAVANSDVNADVIHAASGEIPHSIPTGVITGATPGLSEGTQSAGQDVAKTSTNVLANHAISRTGLSVPEIERQKQEPQFAGGEISKSSMDASPVHAIDRDALLEADVHKQAKQSIDIATDAARPQLSQSPQTSAETMRPGAPENISAVSPSGGSHGGSQSAPGDDRSDHSGKHESGASIPGLSVGSKDLPSVSAPIGFADAMASQNLDGNALKVTTSSATPPNDIAPSLSSGSVLASTPHASDRVEQQRQSLETLISPFQSARLVDRAGQSELHVGFQAGEFGNVDIRTSILRNQVTAEISVERGDLHNLLAVELPHLKEKLASHSAAETTIVLNNQSGGTSSDSRQAYRRFAEAPQGPASRATELEPSPEMSAISESQTASSSQLDIRM